MTGETLTSSEYIKHHLQNLTFGRLPDGTWGLAHSAEQAKEMGFVNTLRNRTFRHLFAAQLVALVGTGLATVALGLLAWQLAGADEGRDDQSAQYLPA